MTEDRANNALQIPFGSKMRRPALNVKMGLTTSPTCRSAPTASTVRSGTKQHRSVKIVQKGLSSMRTVLNVSRVVPKARSGTPQPMNAKSAEELSTKKPKLASSVKMALSGSRSNRHAKCAQKISFMTRRRPLVFLDSAKTARSKTKRQENAKPGSPMLRPWETTTSRKVKGHTKTIKRMLTPRRKLMRTLRSAPKRLLIFRQITNVSAAARVNITTSRQGSVLHVPTMIKRTNSVSLRLRGSSPTSRTSMEPFLAEDLFIIYTHDLIEADLVGI